MSLPPPTEKQARLFWFALTGLALATVIALIVAAVWGLGRVLDLLSPVLWPLAIAGVIACLLSPVVDFFERKKLSRSRAILLVFVVACAVLLGVLASVIPQVVVETEQLAAKVPEYSARLQTRVNEFIAQPPEFLRRFLPPPPAGTDTDGTPENSALASATHWLTGSLPDLGAWLLNRIAKVASGFGLLAGLSIDGVGGALISLPLLAAGRAIWEFFGERIDFESWSGGGGIPVDVEPAGPSSQP